MGVTMPMLPSTLSMADMLSSFTMRWPLVMLFLSDLLISTMDALAMPAELTGHRQVPSVLSRRQWPASGHPHSSRCL
jgi:hypothetical protein